MIAYVDANGVFLYSTDGEAPEGGIAVDPAPEYADQLWLFPGWGPSLIKATQDEDQWREGEYIRATRQIDMLNDDDPKAEPGTLKQWKAYRIALRDWATGGNPYFPDSSKRPAAPA